MIEAARLRCSADYARPTRQAERGEQDQRRTCGMRNHRDRPSVCVPACWSKAIRHLCSGGGGQGCSSIIRLKRTVARAQAALVPISLNWDSTGQHVTASTC